MTPEGKKYLKTTVDSIIRAYGEIDILRNDIKDMLEAAEVDFKEKHNEDLPKSRIAQLANTIRRQNLQDQKTKTTELEILYDEYLGIEE